MIRWVKLFWKDLHSSIFHPIGQISQKLHSKWFKVEKLNARQRRLSNPLRRTQQTSSYNFSFRNYKSGCSYLKQVFHPFLVKLTCPFTPLAGFASDEVKSCCSNCIDSQASRLLFLVSVFFLYSNSQRIGEVFANF